jgi:hypothetical protein
MNRFFLRQGSEKLRIERAPETAPRRFRGKIDRGLDRTYVGGLVSELAARRITTHARSSLDHEEAIWTFLREGVEPDSTLRKRERLGVEGDVCMRDIVIVDLEESREIIG